MKDMDDLYVPMGTYSDNLAAVINKVVRGDNIIFYDKELPFERKMHNKALHITIMCRYKVINHVLVDDLSYLNF